MIRVEDCVELEGKKKYVMGSKKRLFGVVGEGMEEEESGKEHKKRGVAKLKEKLEKKQEQERILGYIKELNVEETWQWLQGGYIIKSLKEKEEEWDKIRK